MREQLMIISIAVGIIIGVLIGANVWADEDSVMVDMYNRSYTVDDVEVRLVSMVDYPMAEYVASKPKELSPRESHSVTRKSYRNTYRGNKSSNDVGNNHDIINMVVRG
mgnify:CR=1 FL=1|jgi:hypothetical protein